MKLLFIASMVLICTTISAQKRLDTKIIITVADSVGLYEKVRLSLVNNDFIVKDTRRQDTVVTYPRDTKPMGYITAIASITGNKVTIWGFVGQRKMNILGYTVAPDDFEKIYYYKTGKSWRALMSIAKSIGGDLSFSE